MVWVGKGLLSLVQLRRAAGFCAAEAGQGQGLLMGEPSRSEKQRILTHDVPNLILECLQGGRAGQKHTRIFNLGQDITDASTADRVCVELLKP